MNVETRSELLNYNCKYKWYKKFVSKILCYELFLKSGYSNSFLFYQNQLMFVKIVCIVVFSFNR